MCYALFMIKVEGRGHNYGVLHIKVEKTASLSDVLAHLNVPNAQELITLGSIYLENQRLQQLDLQLPAGSYLRVHTTPRRFAANVINWKKRVIFDHEDFLILHKPHGIPCHATVDNQVENCLSQMQAHLQQKLFITHRLDTATEGLLLLAKSTNAQRRFNDLLLNHKVQKTYQALTQTSPPTGLQVHFMESSPRAPKTVHLQEFVGGLRCELDILRVQKTAHGYLSEIRLLTGRTHQIRAQLAALGAPIDGDQAYGSKVHFQAAAADELSSLNKGESIGLCAQHLVFNWLDEEFRFSTTMKSCD